VGKVEGERGGEGKGGGSWSGEKVRGGEEGCRGEGGGGGGRGRGKR